MKAAQPGPAFTADEYRRRLDGLRRALERDGLDVAVVMHPADLVYFTGLGLHAQLVVPVDREPVLLVQIDLERAQAQCWIQDIRPSRGFRSVGAVLAQYGLGARGVGLEHDVLPVNVQRRLVDALGAGPGVDVSPAILGLRMVKSPAEVDVFRRAAAIGVDGMAHVRRIIRPGMTEVELQHSLEALEKNRGTDSAMRSRSWQATLPFGSLCAGPEATAHISGFWMTMTGAGPSAAQPYGPTNRPFAPGDLVAVDRAVVLHGYHLDEARTFVVGQPDPEQVRLWGILNQILDAAVAAIRPGRPVGDVYAAAQAAARELGVADRFMTHAVYDFPYVGHGVGLEIDEPPLVSPRDDTLLQPGMVLALEPKIIAPGWGGLTLEDTVAVTASGAEVLSRTPRDWLAAPGGP